MSKAPRENRCQTAKTSLFLNQISLARLPLREMVNCSAFPYIINDFSNVAEREIGQQALEHLATFHFGVLAYHPNCRMIFVTNAPEFMALINKVLRSSKFSSYPVQVLPTLTEARDWLADQPDPNLQRAFMSLRGMYPPEGY